MRRPLAAIAIACLAALFAAAPASAAFGLKGLDGVFLDEHGEVLTQAGKHPFALEVSFAANTKPEGVLGIEVPDGEVKDLTVTNMPGIAGNPTAVPRCSTLDFLDIFEGEPACSPSARVGTSTITFADPDTVGNFAVYNLAPPPGAVLKLGLIVAEIAVTVEFTVKPTPPYNVLAKLTGISDIVPFYAAETTLWGVPADPGHDKERGGPANVPEAPFLTTPRACEGPLRTKIEALSWQGSSFVEEIETHDGSEPPQPSGFTGCEKLGFAPSAAAQPSTDQAAAPTGLDVDIDVHDENLVSPKGIADSDIKKATLTLPQGVTLNPSVAEGLAVCSKAGYEAESLSSSPGEGCPEASKVGTMEAETPLLEGTVLKGQLFVAQQDDPATAQPGAENPFDSLIALYLVIKEPQKGILVKLAGKVSPNPTTGQIETTFGEPGQEIPQFPLSHVHFHLREGGRSPLISPPGCGTYESKLVFTPWADPTHPLTKTSSFQINRGIGGGACPPAGPPPFAPGFEAGTLNNDAHSFSPLDMRLTRRDGDQDLTKFSTALPQGLAAILAGVSRCSDAQIAAAKAKSGRAEIANPSCPANSRIGGVKGGAGVGSQLTYVPGTIYLAGPYNGAPFSVVAIVPAVAGPFDVGNIVTRLALQIDPRTLAVEADGSRSDPIPHILAGIPLSVRDIRAYIDRPNFTFNPTNCDPFAIGAQIWGGGTDLFSAQDDSPVSRSARFQAANCAGLGFKPSLTLRLKGGTKRGGHPALRSVVTTRPHDANFAQAVVRLPRSAFLDQAHIRTICTRVQFAAHACPAGSIYGHARATTPILDEAVEGPVYLRSSNHNLPDLVVALKGPPSAPVDAEVVGRIDSQKGGIRASFEGLPDLPVTKFVLEMQGGKKGLIINSRDLCAKPSRASAELTGQNGLLYGFHPQVKAAGCGGGAAGRGR